MLVKTDWLNYLFFCCKKEKPDYLKSQVSVFLGYWLLSYWLLVVTERWLLSFTPKQVEVLLVIGKSLLVIGLMVVRSQIVIRKWLLSPIRNPKS